MRSTSTATCYEPRNEGLTQDRMLQMNVLNPAKNRPRFWSWCSSMCSICCDDIGDFAVLAGMLVVQKGHLQQTKTAVDSSRVSVSAYPTRLVCTHASPIPPCATSHEPPQFVVPGVIFTRITNVATLRSILTLSGAPALHPTPAHSRLDDDPFLRHYTVQSRGCILRSTSDNEPGDRRTAQRAIYLT